MALDYLDFEYSEDEDGNGTWDAMASVKDSRWEALRTEVQQVLHWATREFLGRQAPLDEGGEWDFDLSAQDEDSGRALRIRWLAQQGVLETESPQTGGYVTLTLTLTGTANFSAALQQAFGIESGG